MLNILFGYFVILACGLGKIPQIRTVLKTRVIQGLSISGILLDIYCYGLSTGFFLHESYPLFNFLEYPLLIIQNVILLLIIGHVSNNLLQSFLVVNMFSVFIYSVAVGVFPKYLILCALSMNGLIGVVSKSAQIRSIRVANTSDSVSYCFYIVNIITSGMRVYTNLLLPSWEVLVIINLVVGMVANLGVCGTIFQYRSGITNAKKTD